MTETKQSTSLKQKSLLDFYEKSIIEISIKDIKIGERIRSSPNKTKINNIAESIGQIGLLNPITISKDKKLICGLHRLKACEKLGWDTIPCVITTIENPLLQELQEIDENLIRYELHFIEKGRHLKRRKEIYEELNPNTKKGASAKNLERDELGKFLSINTVIPSNGITDVPSNSESFVEDTVKKTNFKKSAIYQEIQIVENTNEDIQDFIIEKEISKTDALKIARMPKEVQKKVKEEIEKKGKSKKSYIDNVYAKIKKKEKPKIVPKLPEGKYNVIYADPPWKYQFSESPTRIIEKEYPTMKLEDICKLKIPSAKNSILFLWCPSPKLYPEGMEVIKKWGFEYKTSMVWIKDKIGMGYYARSRHEFLLIGTKGNIGVPEPSNRPDSVIEAPRTEHSKKPEQVYGLIEQMYPNHKYLELFARNKREGWKSWGDEA